MLDGRNPYPPPTAAGVAPGDRFVYPPPVALLLLPFGLLPFGVAAALITVVLLAAVAATLAVLGVRDWRCYGAAYLSIPVLHDVRLGALTPLLALGLALVWRWRSEARASVPAGADRRGQALPLAAHALARRDRPGARRAARSRARRRRLRARLGRDRLRRASGTTRSC